MSGARCLAANLVRVNRTYLSKLEKGAIYPGLEIIAKLAAVLGSSGRRCRGYSVDSGRQPLLAPCVRVRISSDVSEIKLVFSIPPQRPHRNSRRLGTPCH